MSGGSLLNFISIRGASRLVEMNVNNADIDLIANASGEADFFYVDASEAACGIGGVPDADSRLTVRDDGSSSYTVLIESTDTDTAVGPVLALWRNDSSPQDGANIGQIMFLGDDSAGNRQTYASFYTQLVDVTTGTDDSRVIFYATTNGVNSQEYMRYGGLETVFNEGSGDLDFRIESNGNVDMFKLDGGLNSIGVGTAPSTGVGTTLQVTGGTIASYCNVNAVRSDAVATQTMTDDDCQGQMWVNQSSTAWTLDLPESTVAGQTFEFVSTDGDMTVDPNPSGGTGKTLNGGTGALTRSTNNEIYRVICIAADTWIMSNPA